MTTLTTFHLWQNNQSTGPFTARVVRDMLKAGTINGGTLVARDGDDDWLPLSTFSDLIDAPKLKPLKVSESAPVEAVASPATIAQPVNSNMIIIVCTLVVCVTIIFSAHHIASSQEAAQSAVKAEVVKLREKFERGQYSFSEIPLVEMIRDALKEKR